MEVLDNLVSLAIFLLHNKMLSGHKKVKTVLEMKFQDKTKSRRYDCAMQKNDSRKALTTIIKPILNHVHCDMDIFQTSCK